MENKNDKVMQNEQCKYFNCDNQVVITLNISQNIILMKVYLYMYSKFT